MARHRGPRAPSRIEPAEEFKDRPPRRPPASRRAIPIAAAWLDTIDPGVVAAAISTLGRIGSRRATQTLGALLAPSYRNC